MTNLAAYSGLRWGELTALTIAQIDPAARVITVDRKVVEIGGPLCLLGRPEDNWDTPVVTCSAATGDGLTEIWDLVGRHEEMLRDTGELYRRRCDQRVKWMWALVRDQLLDLLRDSRQLQRISLDLEASVGDGTLSLASPRSS